METNSETHSETETKTVLILEDYENDAMVNFVDEIITTSFEAHNLLLQINFIFNNYTENLKDDYLLKKAINNKDKLSELLSLIQTNREVLIKVSRNLSNHTNK